MLEIIVFTCGASLMGLEFLAARMFAPALGSSLFVWGSVISIVMVALSIGYWIGGQLADRLGSTRTLAAVIAAAGLGAVIIPALNSVVLPAVSEFGPRTGSLLASAIVFFVPSLMLAMVSPLGVRLAAAERIEHIGRSAGQLYAISTAGSIFGTLATAFWLIPILTLDGLVISIGFVLFATALLALLLPRRYAEPHLAENGSAARAGVWLTRAAIAFVLLGAVLGALALLQPADGLPRAAVEQGETVIYSKDTQYHRLLVTEDAEERHLRFDRSHQSAMYLDDPFETSFSYPQYLHLALAAKPDSKRVLIVGLGGGSLVKRMWRDYPDMTIDVAEIDPEVIDAAERYFEMPSDARIRIFAEDGRRFLKRADETYDIIVMDAYHADALPSHLTTAEFFAEAKQRLAPDGVLIYNVIASVDGERSDLFRSMYKTAGTVWKRLWVFPIGIGADGRVDANRNIIVIATDNRATRDVFLGRVENRVGGRVSIDRFDEFGHDLYEQPVETGDVPLLTDQHAPTDSLIRVN